MSQTLRSKGDNDSRYNVVADADTADVDAADADAAEVDIQYNTIQYNTIQSINYFFNFLQSIHQMLKN